MAQVQAATAQVAETYLDELAPGHVLLHGQYRIERYLSSGGFGITYLARDSLDRLVVIKECYPGAICHRAATRVRPRSHGHAGEFRTLVNLFLREARNLSKLKHPNIVGVHQVFEDNDTAYMALDLVDGRDLLDIMDSGSLPGPAQVQTMLVRLLDAVAFMHGRDILHRDISPDNILLTTTGEPVLIDFGSAREEATKASRVLTGLLMVKDGYSPQEFYISGSKQMLCSDLYALGATFYHLVTGAAPPDSQTRLAAIATGNPDPCTALAGRFPLYDHAFLAAIDMAMQMFPGDRIQTAGDWLAMIDATRMAEVALARAERDQSIEETVTQFLTVVAGNTPPPEEAAPVAIAPPEPAPPRVIEYIGFDDDEVAQDPGADLWPDDADDGGMPMTAQEPPLPANRASRTATVRPLAEPEQQPAPRTESRLHPRAPTRAMPRSALSEDTQDDPWQAPLPLRASPQFPFRSAAWVALVAMLIGTGIGALAPMGRAAMQGDVAAALP